MNNDIAARAGAQHNSASKTNTRPASSKQTADKSDNRRLSARSTARHDLRSRLRDAASTGNLRAAAEARKQKRNKLKMDALANRLSSLDIAPPVPTVDSLLDKMGEMRVNPEAEPSFEPTPTPLPQPIPIAARIWLKVSFPTPPLPVPAASSLQSLSLALTEVPTLATLQHEIIRCIAETCRVRRRAIPAPDSWSFRVTRGNYQRTFWIGQPSRDLLADGEPIYQSFRVQCALLGEEERERLEAEMAAEQLFLAGRGTGRKQVSRIVQMVGQDEPAYLASSWASCEVSFPAAKQMADVGLDDLPM